MNFDISTYDVVFLSYDEPNADTNYEQARKFIHNLQRVHGVKGSDTAHKACANLAKTDRLVIIDGDNYLIENPLNQRIEIENITDSKSVVLSWPSCNIINGLIYGNGSIKCWDKQQLLDNKTHENSDLDDDRNQIDFCWGLNYYAIDKHYSYVHNNKTKLQAFRAGFREGVKLSLEQGKREFNLRKLSRNNLHRLTTWMSVGDHVENGIWAILGAWHAVDLVYNLDWDITNVRNFDYLNNYFYENVNHIHHDEVLNQVEKIKLNLPEYFNNISILSPDISSNAALNQVNPKRQLSTVKVYEI